ncbi:MAG: hypothetical protein ACRC1H_06285 [Caldilineaceae bacterium]
MSIYRDKPTGQWRFDFDRRINGARVRRRQLLPAGWTRAQADAFDRKESAALYAIATGVARPRHLIDQAVTRYLKERVPVLKAGANASREIECMRDWWAGRDIEDLAHVCAEYAADQLGALAPATIKNRIAYLRAGLPVGAPAFLDGRHGHGRTASPPRGRYGGNEEALWLTASVGPARHRERCEAVSPRAR